MFKHSLLPLAIAALFASAGPAAAQAFPTARAKRFSRRSAARATLPNR